jgi:hypothetical protein
MSQSQQLGDHFSEKLSASELAADAAAYPKFMSGAISTSNSTPNARFLSLASTVETAPIFYPPHFELDDTPLVEAFNCGLQIRKSSIANAGNGYLFFPFLREMCCFGFVVACELSFTVDVFRVFARRSFKKDDVISTYWGWWLAGPARKQKEEMATQSEVSRLVAIRNFGSKYVIDGEPRCVATSINQQTPPTIVLMESELVDNESQIGSNYLTVVALKDISPDEELFLDYGATFWKKP